MRMILMLTLVAVLGIATLSVAQPSEKFTNLQVLDSNITKPQLINVMRSFAGGLGVRCDHCHVERKLPNGEEQEDFASDEKPEKKAAREMMRMVRLINSQLVPNAMQDTANLVKVECVTCHRGQPEPRLIQDVLLSAFTKGGVDSMLTTYTSLREKYYGRHTFDFSDYVLSGVGSEIGANDKAGAVKVLEHNVSLYPNSPGAIFSLARAYADAGDRDKARAALDSCLKVNPDFRPAKQMLEMLNKPETPKN